MGRLAWRLRFPMVLCSQSASVFPVWPSTSRTPMARFAIQREISSEMKEAPKPQTAQKTSRTA